MSFERLKQRDIREDNPKGGSQWELLVKRDREMVECRGIIDFPSNKLVWVFYGSSKGGGF